MAEPFDRVWSCIERSLTQPLGWRKPWRVRVSGDLFGQLAEDEWIDRVFAVMALCPQHTFQVLTKRPERMRDYCQSLGRHHEIDRVSLAMKNYFPDSKGAFYTLGDNGWHFKNIWCGTSVERQQEADERIPLLLQTPAAVRFVSLEPLLGPIDLLRTVRPGDTWDWLTGERETARQKTTTAHLDWVIVGGESGPKARPMSIQWARELRDQCQAAGVSFFFKQWGEWAPARSVPSETPGRFAFGDYEHDRSQMVEVDHYPRQFTKFGARSTLERVGKKLAGRLLDGKEWNQFPQRQP